MSTFTFIAHPSREWEPLLKTMSAITPGQAYTITVSNTAPDATQKLVGVCLYDCEHKGKHVCIDVADPTVFTTVQGAPPTCAFVAYEDNPFGMRTCDKFDLVLNTVSDVDVIGLTFDSNMQPIKVGVKVSGTDDSAASKKSRVSLKAVQLAGGQTLSREASMKAVVAWLDKHNADLAPKYGLTKLVWCEEGSNSRACSGIGVVRGFFRHDVNDGNKRKSLANASAAIEAMQHFTQTKFYDDMLHSSHKYALM